MVLKDVAQIIKQYMSLRDGQIWLKNQKVGLPKDQTFCVTVGFMGNAKTIGSTKRNVEDVETISLTQYAIITIDIFGLSQEVPLRKNEIIMALNSSISNEAQNKLGFSISSHPLTDNDLSALDGAAIPYRFQLTFAVQFMQENKTSFDYYDSFNNEIKTE